MIAHGESGLLRAFWAVCRPLSPDRASDLGADLLGRLGPQMRQHRKVKRNLATAFPEWGADRLETTALASWENFGRVLAEYPHLATITGERWPSYIEVDTQ